MADLRPLDTVPYHSVPYLHVCVCVLYAVRNPGLSRITYSLQFDQLMFGSATTFVHDVYELPGFEI